MTQLLVTAALDSSTLVSWMLGALVLLSVTGVVLAPHAKTVTVDDDVTMVGTCNWDSRSLIWHDEVMAVLYDRALAEEATRQSKDDTGCCGEVTLGTLASQSTWAVLRSSGYRLFSRLL